MKIDKKFGILFWITGLPGSGKTEIAKKIHKKIIKLYGPTICISGDELRKIFKFKGYARHQRLNIAKKYVKLINLLINQKINVIISIVGLLDDLRYENKKKFKNYFEIYIKTNFNVLKKQKNRKFYFNGEKNVWGNDIKPEFPKKPDLIVINNFKENLDNISVKIFKKILNKIKF